MTHTTQTGDDPRPNTIETGDSEAGEHARIVEHRKLLSAPENQPARSQTARTITR